MLRFYNAENAGITSRMTEEFVGWTLQERTMADQTMRNEFLFAGYQ